MLYLKKPEFNFEDTKDLIIPILIYMAAMLVYLSLHEGLHGIIYKIFTKEKLSFRYGLTNAFCGVPQLYVKKWPTLIALITPFVILTAGFVPTIILMPNNVYSLLLIVLFAIHLSSCIGDLYIVGLLFTLSKDVLVNNDGMKYSFYLPKEQVL